MKNGRLILISYFINLLSIHYIWKSFSYQINFQDRWLLYWIHIRYQVFRFYLFSQMHSKIFRGNLLRDENLRGMKINYFWLALGFVCLHILEKYTVNKFCFVYLFQGKKRKQTFLIYECLHWNAIWYKNGHNMLVFADILTIML